MRRSCLILLAAVLFIRVGSGQNPKKVSILGDSYSTCEGYTAPDTNYLWYYEVPRHPTDVRSVDRMWWHLLIQKNGYELEVNNSFSGSTICNTGYQGADYSDRSFITRMDRLGEPDLIFIFGGTNDAWAGVPIGEYRYDRWTPEELYRFRPALACLLESMKTLYPESEIFFLLNSGLKEEVNESVRTVCRHYRIDCIELEGIDKMQGHPSVKGMEQIARQVDRFLRRRDSGSAVR